MNLLLIGIIIFVIFYFLINWFVSTSSAKIAKIIKRSTLLLALVFAILLTFAGKLLFSLPIFALFMSGLKFKGLSAIQIFRLWTLINYLRSKGKFSFDQSNKSMSSNISINEAYKILNLDPAKKYTKKDIKKAHLQIIKKVHPDVSPSTAKLCEYVNAARDIILKDLN